MVDKKPKNKEKEADDPRFERTYTKDLDAFVDQAKKEIEGLDVIEIKVYNKEQPHEKVLRYKGKRIAQVPPRAGMLFGLYLFSVGGPKEIIHIHNDKEIKLALDKIKSICAYIDKNPSKIKSAPKPKTESKGLENLLLKFDNLKPLKGMKVPPGFYPDNKTFIKEIEKRHGKFDWDNRMMFKAEVEE